MKQLLILSGKGGTGKTTVAAAFIHFSQAQAMADCDVDAPNLHLVTSMATKPERSDFIGADKASIDPAKCTGCGRCLASCRFDAITQKNGPCAVIPEACEGCGVCAYVCPCQAITMNADVAGEQQLYRSAGRVFSTAALKMGRGNSGKLVTAVKQAMEKHAPVTNLAIIDGSPGIGCPVIASVSGVDLVLVVAEPSVSGRSDLERLTQTARSLEAKIAVCVNKWDASPENAAAIEAICKKLSLPFVGRIPYDRTASLAINAGKSIAELDCPARTALREIYRRTMEILG